MLNISDDNDLLTAVENPSVYFEEVDYFHSWCVRNHLTLNVVKKKEMVFDPRRPLSHHLLITEGSEIEQVEPFKYFGVCVDSLLKWNMHLDLLCRKLSQMLLFFILFALWSL